jgi:hypothetical protein
MIKRPRTLFNFLCALDIEENAKNFSDNLLSFTKATRQKSLLIITKITKLLKTFMIRINGYQITTNST